LWLVAGLIESTVSQYIVVQRDQVLRSVDSTLYIAGLVMLWVFVMFAGLALHEASVPIPY
jgi:hypothetical protein